MAALSISDGHNGPIFVSRFHNVVSSRNANVTYRIVVSLALLGTRAVSTCLLGGSHGEFTITHKVSADTGATKSDRKATKVLTLFWHRHNGRWLREPGDVNSPG